MNDYEKTCVSSHGSDDCLRHIKLCQTAGHHFVGNAKCSGQIWRTRILTERVQWKWARSPIHCCYSQSRGALVCYLNHIRNALSTKDLGIIFICGINCLDSWKPACISVLLKWLRFCSWCLCLLHYQRQAKYSENKLKSIKARNEYLLTLEATNASVFKYYIHDLSDLIDVSTWRFVYRKCQSLMRQCHYLLV